MSDWDLKILCMGAGYVGGPTMAVIAKMCPKVRIKMTFPFLWCLMVLIVQFESTSNF